MPELDQYDYVLPPELIAQEPLPNRADARLLVVDRQSQSVTHAHVRDLPELLHKNDCLVCNNTQVIPARMLGSRAQTGGKWEGLFLRVDTQGAWHLLCKTRGAPRSGELIDLIDRHGNSTFQLRLIAREPNGIWLVRPEQAVTPLELLEKVGRVPLPPYIRDGEMTDADVQRYQTVFAQSPGAVAAPTAGLHFTPRLLTQLQETGVQQAQVTLHVGIDTFRPISVDRLDEHPMHSEWGEISESAVSVIKQAQQADGRVVAVGTTSVRVLETASSDGNLRPWSGQTNLFIRPPYEFRTVDVLLTNFHLPRTTLLVMIYAFGGPELMRRAYAEAITEGYRFYSYGDAMLIL